jgi:hypothetical protein
MAKVHLRANKLIDENTRPRAVCATRPGSNGKVLNNGRASYRFMASEIVGRPEFAKVAPADRCAHCLDTGLVMRNIVRKQKGLPPLESLFSDLEA